MDSELRQAFDGLRQAFDDLGRRVDDIGKRLDAVADEARAARDEARDAYEKAIGGAQAVALVGEDIRRNNQLLIDTIEILRATDERVGRLAQDWVRARTDHTERLIALHEQMRVFGEELRLFRKGRAAPAPS